MTNEEGQAHYNETMPLPRAPGHTPGPWSVGHVGRCTHDVVQIHGPQGELLFDFRHSRATTDDQMRPNARLIAAAPDMLAALRECASRCRYDGDHHSDLGLESRRDASWEAMRMAERAIAKVEGLPDPYADDNQPLSSTE